MSPAGAFGRILDRYGQRVTVHRAPQDPGAVSRGFLQPIQERGEDRRQVLPTPLGLARQDRYLYLGEPGTPLEGMEEGFLLCRGQAYEVMTAHAVYVGERISHWQAVLRAVGGEGAG